jgi:hypothetical protein
LRGNGTNSIVVANANKTVTIRGVDYATTGIPQSLAVGDVDGDGIPDVIAATDQPVVSVLLSVSPGVFRPSVDYATKGGAAIASADLDGDGRADLAAGGGWNGVSVIPNMCLP